MIARLIYVRPHQNSLEATYIWSVPYNNELGMSESMSVQRKNTAIEPNTHNNEKKSCAEVAVNTFTLAMTTYPV